MLRPEVSSVGSVDSWSFGAGINAGPLLRSINKVGRISGDGFTPKVIWAIVKANAKSCGLATIGPHEVALAWLRHQTVPVIPIIGARKVSRLQDNLASLDLELSAEQLKSLDGASRIDLGFPQSDYEKETVRAVRYGGIWDRLLLDCSIPFLANGNIKLQSPLYLALVKKCDRTSTFVIFLV